MPRGDPEARKLKSGTRFQKEGKYSRGWWLAWIMEGASNNSKLMTAAGAAYPTTVFVFRELEKEGMIRNTSQNARPCYLATDWGEMEFRRYKSGKSEKPGKNPDRRPVPERQPFVQTPANKPQVEKPADQAQKPNKPAAPTPDEFPDPPKPKVETKITADKNPSPTGSRVTEIKIGGNITITIRESANAAI